MTCDFIQFMCVRWGVRLAVNTFCLVGAVHQHGATAQGGVTEENRRSSERDLHPLRTSHRREQQLCDDRPAPGRLSYSVATA
jgi:hypothetical protein